CACVINPHQALTAPPPCCFTNRRRRNTGASLILIDVPNRDDRVAEILRDPARYFANARTRAWTAAATDIDTDLAQRAQRRLNHHSAPPPYPPTWLPPTTDMPANN